MQVPFFAAMKIFGLLRVPPEQEHEGLDISHHGGSAYPKEFVKLEKGGDLSQHGGILAVRCVVVVVVVEFHLYKRKDGFQGRHLSYMVTNVTLCHLMAMQGCQIRYINTLRRMKYSTNNFTLVVSMDGNITSTKRNN